MAKKRTKADRSERQTEQLGKRIDRRPDEIEKKKPTRENANQAVAKRRTVQRAATMVAASMMGISISSAFLVPTRGTTNNVRIVPSTKPTPNTSAK
ncbi:MAG: hypothetical protein ACLP0H_02290 [Terriglobales bacterium]